VSQTSQHSKEKRSLQDLEGLPRSAARSLWRSRTEEVPHEERSGVGLLSKRFLPWLWNYLKVALLPRERFREYGAPLSSRPGIYRLPNDCVVALASDWGTGTASAYRVRDGIVAANPHVTIHLGDVYYSGTTREFRDYFLGAEDWPRGSLRPADSAHAAGTYALNANHEMYSGGAGYFNAALPALQQETSYFCLENDHWRILAVDSGYYAKSFPFLELIVDFIRLHKSVRRWLREVVFADSSDRRPVILLSHHQWFSAFDSEYKRLGKHLAPYMDRVLLWFWGHEHRFAGYAPFGFGSASVRARCIGHGGMPIELGDKIERQDRPLVFSDTRRAGRLDDVDIGFCGYAVLRFAGPALHIEYLDEHQTRLLEERWTLEADGAVGAVALGSLLETYDLPLEALVE